MISQRTAKILGAATFGLLAVAVNVNGCGGDDNAAPGTTSAGGSTGSGGSTGAGGKATTSATSTTSATTTSTTTGAAGTAGGGGGGSTGAGGSKDAGNMSDVKLRDDCTPSFTAATAFPGTIISDFGSDAGLNVQIAGGGAWAAQSGGTTIAIANDADGGGGNALHITGTGNSQVVAASFLVSGQPINASTHTGVRLNLRGSVTAGTDAGPGHVLLRLQNPINRPEACVCEPVGGTAANACFGGLFADLGTLPTTYMDVSKLFTDVSSPGFGLNQTAVDPSSLVQIILITDATASWDVWIKTVSFY